MRTLPMLLLLGLGLAWAVRLLAIKAASQIGASPIEIAIAASAGIVVVLSLYNLMRGDALPLSAKHIRFYVLAGIFGFAAPFLAENLVAPKLPAALFVVIVTSTPIWTVLVSIMTRLEPFN